MAPTTERDAGGRPDLEARFELRLERFRHGPFAPTLLLPRSSDALIDVSAFNVDERLPYWAELWPAARGLARFLLEAEDLPAAAIELGCGVGLPSLALRSRGVDVLATDYYEEALLFARENAARNDLAPLRTRIVDWRSPPRDLPRFPLAVAADVLYEARNVPALAAALAATVEPGGRCVLADPGRTYLAAFLETMRGAGWTREELPPTLEAAPHDERRRLPVRRIVLTSPAGS